MKRIGIVAFLFLLGAPARAQFAPQVWSADQDGGDFLCYDVHSLQVNNMSGVGIRCVEVDATGTFFPIACPVAGVSSVTGTPQRVSATPTTGAVVVDTIGGFYSGAVSGGNENLGANASGVEQQITTAGVAVLSTFATGATRVELGATSGGGLADSANLTWDGHVFKVGTATTPTTGSQAAFYQSANGSDDLLIANDNAGTGAQVAVRLSRDTLPATTDSLLFALTGTNFGSCALGGVLGCKSAVFELEDAGNFGVSVYGPGDFIVATTTSRTPRFYVKNAGNEELVTMTVPSTPASGELAMWGDSTAKNLFVKNDAGTVNHGAQTQTAAAGKAFTALADGGGFTETSFQTPLVACTDYVSLTCVTGATDLGGTNATPTVTGIENEAFMRGDLLALNKAAPGAPGVGTARVYVDSTSRNICSVNNSGTVNHGVQTDTGTASQWIRAIADTGAVTKSQPAFTDVSGSATCAQLPALVGDATSSAGSCSTKVKGVTDGANVDWPVAGTFANNQAMITSGGNWTTTNECNVFSSCPAGGSLTGTYPNPSVAFSGVTGSVTCAQLPAQTGDSTSAAGSCVTKNVAITETGGPTTLTIAAIPNLNPLPDVLVRDGVGGNTIIGFPPGSIADYVTKRDYTLDSAIGAFLGSDWMLSGNGFVSSIGVVVEYPNDFKAGHIQVTAQVLSNSISVGTLTAFPTMNGAAIGSSFAFTSASSGQIVHAVTTTGSTGTTDLFGFAYQTSVGYTAGFVAFSFQVVLSP